MFACENGQHNDEAAVDSWWYVLGQNVPRRGRWRGDVPIGLACRRQQASATVEKNGVDAEADVTTALFDKLTEDMTESQYTVVKNLLKNYVDVFYRDVFDMGRTLLVEHVIDTGDHRPIRQGLRRHAIAHLDAIDQQVDDLLRNDFIEPAASP